MPLNATAGTSQAHVTPAAPEAPRSSVDAADAKSPPKSPIAPAVPTAEMQALREQSSVEQANPARLAGSEPRSSGRVVAPTPIAGHPHARWDESISVIFDVAVGQVDKADLRATLEKILAAQSPGGGWHAGSDAAESLDISVLNHTAVASVLRAGLFQDDPHLHLKLEAALAVSWVNLCGFKHTKIGSDALDPLPNRRVLAKAHPVAKAFHMAAYGTAPDGKRIPEAVIEAARELNRSATVDPAVGQAVRPAAFLGALTTLLATTQQASPAVLGAAGATVGTAFALAGPGIVFLAGITLAYANASFMESFFHDNMHHASARTREIADKIGGPVARQINSAYLSHHGVHHGATFNPDYTVQFRSEAQREKLRARLEKMGEHDIIEEDFGATLSMKQILKFLGVAAPAVAAIGLAFGPVGLAGAMIPTLLYPAGSKVLHPYLHKKEAELADAPAVVKWILDTPIGRQIARNHYIHHKRNHGNDVNYNLFGWFGDWIRGKYDQPTLSEMESMREDGIPA